ncbi:MAG: hypothetical protein JWP01_549 [Myxococcales bacterium]|nr:hypothetical protein [Myxococcales bacterium]
MALVVAAVIATACGGARTPAHDSPAPAPPVEAETPIVPAAEPSVSTPAPVEARPVEPVPVANNNPAGCPAAEPNVNTHCEKNSVACSYGTRCGIPLYVCVKHRFEARFESCP